ncbi:MAG: hypothetical protein H6526_03345 [Actinobacteria bacterium]|nr:hypothetical protein [Actinomycetota bacterium]MCB8997810.1 hypothetical protein [Actinomycetota bacterium]MCB9414296.1 hypothetical protein [Actinomycetota bacterium]MCB9424041.1 hypothetical protein [Actinomycetota bacterium]HRY11016.1 hypothetical protein [Candidatus Nanopelagicales bacterium]
MRVIVVLAAAMVLAGCSSTQNEPQQTPLASDVAQNKVDQFCRDLADALTRGGTTDPEDGEERLSELGELASEFGLRDDLSVAQALRDCADEIAGVTASPTPSG